nr:MAG TPA: hypothetical protein [Microviridae sp.]
MRVTLTRARAIKDPVTTRWGAPLGGAVRLLGGPLLGGAPVSLT